MTEPKPFNPAIGDRVIATDAFGRDREVTVVEEPWRGHSMVMVTICYGPASGDVMPWPLTALRPMVVSDGD